MSLRIWLPLNGDLRQLGISNAIATNDGATVDNNGKIGKCYSFNNTHIIIDSTDVQDILSSTTQPFSMACWIYLNSDETDRVIIFGNYSANPFVNWELLAGCTQRLCAGGTSNYTNRTNSTVVPKTTWTHIAVTYDGATTTFYQNGASAGSVAGANTLTTKTASSRFYLGSDVRNDVTRLKGKMNDFRFYDHCLSAAEVKEISQGLILHYKLDSFQGNHGNPNLITDFDTSFLSYADGSFTLFTNQMNGGTQEIISNFAGATKCVHFHSSGGSNRQFKTFIATQGKTYTVSADYYSTTIQNTAWRGELNGGDYSWMGASGGVYDTPGAWKRMSYTYSNLTSNALIYFFTYCNNGTDCYVKNIKIEEGLSATAWGPPGTSTTIIQDNSGYNHNGTITGSPFLQAESIRYQASIRFNENNDCIKIPPLFTNGQTVNELSVSCWFKTNTLNSTAPNIFSLGSNSFCRARIASNTSIWWYTRVAGTSAGTTATCKTLTDNNWHLMVYTFKNGIEKMYIDGEQIGIADKTSTGTYLTCNSVDVNSWVLGGYSVSSERFIGNESDFRIYCTSLLDTDVKQLYNVGMKIDKLGSVHSFEFIEQQSNIIFPIELSRSNLTFTNGLSRYTQTNCQVTLTDEGYHIYRPPNLTTANDGNTMWGGLKLVNQSSDGIHPYDSGDNIWNLQKSHTYIFAFHAKGKSSNAPSLIVESNMGWDRIAGVGPNPTYLATSGIPADFNGEKDCFIIFTINDDIIKTATETKSNYVVNNQYLSYRHLSLNYGYTSTGTLGTDLYLTNFRLYDITTAMAKITKQGQVKFYNFVEQLSKAQIRRNSEFLASHFIER